MKKKILFAGFALVLISLAWGTTFADKVYKIGVTQIVTHPALDATRNGFYDQMDKEGFKEGENVKYDFRNPEGDMSLVASIAKKFVSEKVDLIMSITTPSTQACVAAAKGSDIPVILSGVTDPVTAKVVDSWDKPGGNCTGVSDWIEIGPQLQIIKEIYPDIKKIGTIYNSGETNSVVQVKELKKAAPDFGIVEVVEVTAATSADIYAAANSLVGRVDAIWVGADNTVVSAFDSVIKVCEKNQILLFTTDVSMVERGSIAAIGFSYYTVGVETAKIAARVLKGEDPASIPVRKIKLTDLYLNPLAAERMGITIQQAMLDRATKVIRK